MRCHGGGQCGWTVGMPCTLLRPPGGSRRQLWRTLPCSSWCLVALLCFVSRARESSPLQTVKPRDFKSQGLVRDPAVPYLAKMGLSQTNWSEINSRDKCSGKGDDLGKDEACQACQELSSSREAGKCSRMFTGLPETSILLTNYF